MAAPIPEVEPVTRATGAGVFVDALISRVMVFRSSAEMAI
jgi:hypothetical protein